MQKDPLKTVSYNNLTSDKLYRDIVEDKNNQGHSCFKII